MVTAALVVLGENDVPPEERPKRLLEIILLQKETIRLPAQRGYEGVDPDLDRLTESAAYAIEAGQLVEADSHLAELEEREERPKARRAASCRGEHEGRARPDCT